MQSLLSHSKNISFYFEHNGKVLEDLDPWSNIIWFDFFFFFGHTAQLWDLSSLTSIWTWALGSESAESTGPPGNSIFKGFSGGSGGKESACSEGDPGSIPKSGRSPGEGNSNPLLYSCLGNPMDRGDCWATAHGITKSQTRLNDSLSGASHEVGGYRAAPSKMAYTGKRVVGMGLHFENRDSRIPDMKKQFKNIF